MPEESVPRRASTAAPCREEALNSRANDIHRQYEGVQPTCTSIEAAEISSAHQAWYNLSGPEGDSVWETQHVDEDGRDVSRRWESCNFDLQGRFQSRKDFELHRARELYPR